MNKQQSVIEHWDIERGQNQRLLTKMAEKRDQGVDKRRTRTSRHKQDTDDAIFTIAGSYSTKLSMRTVWRTLTTLPHQQIQNKIMATFECRNQEANTRNFQIKEPLEQRMGKTLSDSQTHLHQVSCTIIQVVVHITEGERANLQLFRSLLSKQKNMIEKKKPRSLAASFRFCRLDANLSFFHCV